MIGKEMCARNHLLLIFCLMTTTIAKNYYIHESPAVCVGGFESPNSCIAYVMINGSRYIVKQKKSPNKQFSVVRDALAAYIAKDLAIAHSVEIIPAKKQFPGKKNKIWPAALLIIASGKMVRALPHTKYYELDLKQRAPHGKFLSNRWLTETMINQMTWHKQLPIIIGLDLFICNTDRHGANIFYDEITDCFCAIDMDNIFRRDLPMLACKKLQLMIDHQKKFTAQEVEALVSVRDTLQFLLNTYTSEQLIATLYRFAYRAGFTEGSPLYSEKVARKLARHEETIIKSRVSAKALIKILDKIAHNFYRKSFIKECIVNIDKHNPFV